MMLVLIMIRWTAGMLIAIIRIVVRIMVNVSIKQAAARNYADASDHNLCAIFAICLKHDGL